MGCTASTKRPDQKDNGRGASAVVDPQTGRDPYQQPHTYADSQSGYNAQQAHNYDYGQEEWEAFPEAFEFPEFPTSNDVSQANVDHTAVQLSFPEPQPPASTRSKASRVSFGQDLFPNETEAHFPCNLLLTLIGATNLPFWSVDERCDAYVKISNSSSGFTEKTNIIRNNTNPVWDSPFTIPVRTDKDEICFEVYNSFRGNGTRRKAGNAQKIGVCYLSLQQGGVLPAAFVPGQEISLDILSDGPDPSAGKLRLCATWEKTAQKGSTPRSRVSSTSPQHSRNVSLQPVVSSGAENKPHRELTPSSQPRTSIDTEKKMQDDFTSPPQRTTSSQQQFQNGFDHGFDNYVFPRNLVLTLVGASGLPKMDTIGWCDPYVIIQNYLSGFNAKTKTIKNTADPVWDAVFTIPVSSSQDEIIFDVYDYDTIGGDDYIGICKLPVNHQFLSGQEFKLEIRPEGKGPGGGHLVMHAIWESEAATKTIHKDFEEKKSDPKSFGHPRRTEDWEEKKRDSKSFSHPQITDLEEKKRDSKSFGRPGITDLEEKKRDSKSFSRPGITASQKTSSQFFDDETQETSWPHSPSGSEFSAPKTPRIIEYEFPCTLVLTIVGALSLPKMDTIGWCDPYVVLTNKTTGYKSKTSTIMKTANPVWDAVFRIPVSSEHDEIDLDVYDYDRVGKDEYIGICRVALHHSVICGRECVLDILPEGRGKGGGKLRIKGLWEPLNQAHEEVITKHLHKTTAQYKVPVLQPFREDSFPRTMMLTIIGASNLPKMDTIGWCDPYIILTNKGTGFTFKTSTVYDNANPVWEATFKVIVSSPQDELVFEVYDYDLGKKDDYIGICQLPLDQRFICGRECALDIMRSTKGTTRTGGQLRYEAAWAEEAKPVREIGPFFYRVVHTQNVLLRKEPDVQAETTGLSVHPGEIFEASERVKPVGSSVFFAQISSARDKWMRKGWVFEKVIIEGSRVGELEEIHMLESVSKPKLVVGNFFYEVTHPFGARLRVSADQKSKLTDTYEHGTILEVSEKITPLASDLTFCRVDDIRGGFLVEDKTGVVLTQGDDGAPSIRACPPPKHTAAVKAAFTNKNFFSSTKHLNTHVRDSDTMEHLPQPRHYEIVCPVGTFARRTPDLDAERSELLKCGDILCTEDKLKLEYPAGVNRGHPIFWLRRKEQYDWVRLEKNGIIIAKEIEDHIEEGVWHYKIVAPSGCPIRQGPSLTHDALNILAEGTTVTVQKKVILAKDKNSSNPMIHLQLAKDSFSKFGNFWISEKSAKGIPLAVEFSPDSQQYWSGLSIRKM